jgi:uncharacterized protein YbaR (Trm112 family)
VTPKPSVLPSRLLAKLACPKCHGALEDNQAAEQLICKGCQLGYIIRRGVPVLLIDEAIKIQ